MERSADEAASEFDEIIERRGTHAMKWDMMEARYGVPAEDGIAMWVADMDFRAAPPIRAALARMLEHGVFGYYGDDRSCREAIRWWMATRHGWQIETEWIFTTHGLVNGTALVIDAFTEPGDGVMLFTPVYHAFARVIRAAGREVVEVPLAIEDGPEGPRYLPDLERAEALAPRAKLLIWCAPHNPGGRVWSREEQRAIADLARRHGMLLVSDEIHHDLVYPGQRHVPMAVAAPEAADRLIMMTATTKTFNIAGAHTGNVIIADEGLRRRFAARLVALGISPNAFGMVMAEAAYSPEGAAWVDRLMRYLDGNRRLFDEGVNAIPGVRSMPLEGTYLAWVDFRGTGMDEALIAARIEKDARIAVNHGSEFGTGGEGFMRFNLATPRARVAEAVARLRRAFADLQ